MNRDPLSEGELVAAIWDAADYKSVLVARALLGLAHANGLLVRERSASVSIRITLGPGERPATLFTITESGRFFSYKVDRWPRRFRHIGTAYHRALRSMFGARVIAVQSARLAGIPLREVADKMPMLKRLVRETIAPIRAINATDASLLPDALVGLEGDARRRMILHRKREGWLRDARIALVSRDTGRVACEVSGCGFDFKAVYGPLGDNYAQVHHVRALSTSAAVEKTRVSDLRVVCANCHAMIHVGGKSRSLTIVSQGMRKAPGIRRRSSDDE